MTVSQADRRAARVLWRRLTQLAIQALAPGRQPAHVKPVTRDAITWVAPTDDADQTRVCGMFAQVFMGWARLSTTRDRSAVAPALRQLAEMVGDLLDATDQPPPAQSSSILPFRRDVDG